MSNGILFYVDLPTLDHTFLTEIMQFAQAYAQKKGKICSAVVIKKELHEAYRMIEAGEFEKPDEVYRIRVRNKGSKIKFNIKICNEATKNLRYFLQKK